MASTITIKEVLYRVSAQLHDISPQFTRWTQRELVAWLNDGQRAIAKYMPWSCSRVDVIKLSPGTRQYIGMIQAASIKPGDGSTPADVSGNVLQSAIRNMGANGTTPGPSIRLIDKESLDLNTPDWHTSTGSVITGIAYDVRTPKFFYVTPGVAPDASVWIEVSMLTDPASIDDSGDYGMDGSDATPVSVSDKDVDDLVNYIIARAYMKDAEYANNSALAAGYTSMFVGSINSQAVALTGVNPKMRNLPMAGGSQ